MNVKSRRYIIIGAGAIGGAIGGRLARAGRDTVLVARGEHLEALRIDGLILAEPEGSQVLRIPAVRGPAELALTGSDVLVLTVKSQDTGAALDTWANASVRGGGATSERLPLLCVQNGVENERLALRRFASVYSACVWLPAIHLHPGHVAIQSAPIPGIFELGRYPAGIDDFIGEVGRDFADAGFLAHTRPDVLRWKYAKLVRNLANSIDAALRPSVAADTLYDRAVAEAQAVFAAAGIPVASLDEEKERRATLDTSRPVAGLEPAGFSSWQSLAKKSGTIEADYLNGEIVLLGRLHGVATPVNAALQRIANLAARSGAAPRSFSADEIGL